jgi:hypothetical protein
VATTNVVTGVKPKLIPLRPGTRTDSTGRTVKNVLLLSIPDREYNLIRPYLEYVELEHHKMLHDQGQQIEFAYFPNDGMVSLVVSTSDGRSVEVGIVGREGMVGDAVSGRSAPRALRRNHPNSRQRNHDRFQTPDEPVVIHPASLAGANPFRVDAGIADGTSRRLQPSP